MDFEHSKKSLEYQERLLEFMDEHIYPNERTYAEQLMAQEDVHSIPPVMEQLKK